MSATLERRLRCTLHWFENDQPCQQDLLLPDRAIGEIVAALVASLGLADSDTSAREMGLGLRRGLKLRALPLDDTLTESGIRDGEHLWLTPEPVEKPAPPQPAPSIPIEHYTCDVLLPDGALVRLPSKGQEIDRGWILSHLTRPEQFRERFRYRLNWLRQGPASPYLAVSTKPHCHIRPRRDGIWEVITTRNDIPTWINGKPLSPNRAVSLRDHTELRPGGADGPVLVVRLFPQKRQE